MTDTNPSPEKPKGVLDRLVDLFRSNPPDEAAKALEKQLDEAPEKEKPPEDDHPVPLYKGVSL